MKKLLLLSSICLLFSCEAEYPQARLLMGNWKFVELTQTHNNSIQKANPAWPKYVSFNADGTTGQEAGSYPFTGGRCNYASTYTYTKEGAYSYSLGKVQFTFSEPKCIPFLYIPEQPIATVVELTDTSLVINWNGLIILYQRI